MVHIQTSAEAVEDLLKVVSELAEKKKAAGFVRPEKTIKVNDPSNIYKDVYVRRG